MAKTLVNLQTSDSKRTILQAEEEQAREQGIGFVRARKLLLDSRRAGSEGVLHHSLQQALLAHYGVILCDAAL